MPALKLDFTQYVEDLAAQGFPRLLQLGQQGQIYVSFPGLFGHQVPQMADLGLTDAVDPAKALFDAVGVPGQVVIHHKVGTLEVDPFSGGIGSEQYLDAGVVPEGLPGRPYRSSRCILP